MIVNINCSWGVGFLMIMVCAGYPIPYGSDARASKENSGRSVCPCEVVPMRAMEGASSRATKFYAVRRGRLTGFFYTWPECESQVKGFSNAEFKSFKVREDALRYLGFK
jgi:hypothetical protein